uniref:Uncharacterized protein n=1 Tax=Romanomermis culicivorax TaxID=13658 RepID=A0A915IIR2_ROMCU
MLLLVNWIKRQEVEDVYLEFIKRTYISKFDVDESNQAIAEKIWKSGAFTIKSPDIFGIALLDDIVNPCEAIRESAAEAISNFLEEIKSSNSFKKPQTLQVIISGLLTKISLLFEENSFMIMPVYDDFGRLVSEGGVDKWEARSGLALTLRKLCPYLPNSLLQNYFNIILPKGINDRSPNVSHLMLLAAVEGVKIHGKVSR